MKIPDGPSGFPTLSSTQYRTYGTSGSSLEEEEAVKGCPRLYHERYVAKTVPKDAVKPYPLWYGAFFHDVLFGMEQHGYTPDEALEKAYTADMPAEFWTEARNDLFAYIERAAGPMDLFATLEVETELSALLYVDEDFGPIYFRGFIDWLGLDPDYPNVLRVTDYKTNRQPPHESDLHGDVQLRGYHWLVRENAERWGIRNPRIITSLDVVKFRSVEIPYTDDEIDDWHTWAVAVARQILRDEEHLPIINEGCAWCPVRYNCPAFETLPDVAATLSRETFEDDAQRLAWRDKANAMRLLLEKSVKQMDEELKTQVRAARGPVVIGGQRLSFETEFENYIDLRVLHSAIGEQFYDIVTTSKAKIDALMKGKSTDEVAAAKAAIERRPKGLAFKRSKAPETKSQFDV